MTPGEGGHFADAHISTARNEWLGAGRPAHRRGSTSDKPPEPGSPNKLGGGHVGRWAGGRFHRGPEIVCANLGAGVFVYIAQVHDLTFLPTTDALHSCGVLCCLTESTSTLQSRVQGESTMSLSC